MLLVIQCYFLNCHVGNSMVIQWLGITLPLQGQRFNPWLGTKILHIMWPKTNKQTKLSCKDIFFSWSLSNSLGIKKNVDIPINQIFMVKTKTTKELR